MHGCNAVGHEARCSHSSRSLRNRTSPLCVNLVGDGACDADGPDRFIMHVLDRISTISAPASVSTVVGCSQRRGSCEKTMRKLSSLRHPRASFIEGMARVLDLGARLSATAYRPAVEDDQAAFAHDWRMLSADAHHVRRSLGETSAADPPLARESVGMDGLLAAMRKSVRSLAVADGMASADGVARRVRARRRRI